MAELIVADQTVSDNANWNFGVNLLDITFFTLGLSLVSRDTVMPVLVSHLTDSKLAIGLIPAIFSLCFYLPQLLIANFSERLRYKKPFTMLLGGVGERGGYLLIALSIWLFAKNSPTLALVLIFVSLAISATCSGTATPAWFDMIAKVIPTHRRGLFAGLGHSLGALASVIAAFFVGWVLEQIAYPNNFALLFLAAFIAMGISWIGLSLTREPPSTTVKEHMPLARYLRQLPAILRKDSNYLRYLLARNMDIFVIHLLSREEVEPELVGDLRLVDAEDEAGVSELADRILQFGADLLPARAEFGLTRTAEHAIGEVRRPKTGELDQLRLFLDRSRTLLGVNPVGIRVAGTVQEALRAPTDVPYRTDFDLDLAPSGTDFQRKVWTALSQIPYGTTESYGQLALRIGQPTASRAVGLANGRNPIAIVVPCHRVIGSSGTLTGYAGGLERKRWLLEHERVWQDVLPAR